MKKRKKMLAVLLTLALSVGNLAGVGVYADALSGTMPEEDSETSGADIGDAGPEADIGDAEPEADVDGTDPADFVKSADNTMFGTAGMADPSVPQTAEDNWEGSYIYFGQYLADYKTPGKEIYLPLKFRVLDKSTTEFSKSQSGTNAETALLDCNTMTHGDRSYAAYAGVDVITTSMEGDAIAKSYKDKPTEGLDGNPEDVNWDFVPLDDREFFYLDIREATRPTYGYWRTTEASNSRKKRNTEAKQYMWNWWIRSYRVTSPDGVRYLHYIDDDGSVDRIKDDDWRSCSPAFNLSLDKLLFSSAISGSKGQTDTEYKLTLLTDLFTADISSMAGAIESSSGTEVRIPYSVSGTYPAWVNAMSVLILDGAYNLKAGNGNTSKILYYGKLDTAGDFSPNGTGSFVLPSSLSIDKWGSDYRVYLIAEQMNGAKETDYAAVPVEITSDWVYATEGHSVTFNANGHGTAPASQYLEEGAKASKPADPAEDGFLFRGWYTNPECSGVKYDFYTPVTKDISLYARWVKEKVKVTFDMNGSSDPKPATQTITGDSCALEPEKPTRVGYTFGGWCTNKEGGKASIFDFAIPVEEDMTLYAWWRRICTVTFDRNGGYGYMNSLRVSEGDHIFLPVCEFTPPDDEKAFGGWEIKGERFAANKKMGIYADTVIKASWYDLDMKTVRFHNKYGDYEEVRVLYLTKVDRPSPDPVYEDHTFLGWYKDIQFDDNKANDEYLYDFNSIVRDNMDLYTAWTDDTEYHLSVKEDRYAPGGSVSADKAYVKSYDDVTLTFYPEDGFIVDHISGVPYWDTRFLRVSNKWNEPVEGNTYSFQIPDMTKAEGGYKNIKIEVCFKADHEHEFVYHDGEPASCSEKGTFDYAECTKCGHKYKWDKKTDTVDEDSDLTKYTESEWRIVGGYHGFSNGEDEPVERTEPTCTTSGNEVYVRCRDCGAYLIGPNWQCEGTLEDTIIPIDVNAHAWDVSTVSYNWAEDNRTVTGMCTCSYNEAHRLREEVGVTVSWNKAPTCTEGGNGSFTSEAFAHDFFSVQTRKDVDVPALGHDWNSAEYKWSEDLKTVSADAVCRNDAAHRESETVNTRITHENGYRKCVAAFTRAPFKTQTRYIVEVRFLSNGKDADMPEAAVTDLGMTISRPDKDPKAEDAEFTGWYSDEECTELFDFDSPIPADLTLYAGWKDDNEDKSSSSSSGAEESKSSSSSSGAEESKSSSSSSGAEESKSSSSSSGAEESKSSSSSSGAEESKSSSSSSGAEESKSSSSSSGAEESKSSSSSGRAEDSKSSSSTSSKDASSSDSTGVIRFVYNITVKNPDGSAVGVEVYNPGSVSYNGRKHVSNFNKTNKSTTADVSISVNSAVMDYALPMPKFKNNKLATVSGASIPDKKRPYYIMSFKAKPNATREQKAVLKQLNKQLKTQPVYFIIEPADLSKAKVTANVNPAKNKATKVVATIDGIQMKLGKKDYTTEFTDGKAYIKGMGNFRGKQIVNN